MTLYARDIMVRDFSTIHMNDSAENAIRNITYGKIRETGYKTISLMVVDDLKKLVGIITMFDVLYHLRPDFLNFGINGDEVKWNGQLESLLKNLHGMKVENIMTHHVIGASKDDHIMVVLDRMIKNRYRRLPILEDEKPIGIVYISDIFCRLFKKI